MTQPINSILIPVKAIHYKNTQYSQTCNCALANAASDFFDTPDVSEEVWYIYIKGIKYSHAFFSHETYISDYNTAMKRKFSSTLTIRHLILQPEKK